MTSQAPAATLSDPATLCAEADRVSDRRGPMPDPAVAVGSLDQVLAVWQSGLDADPQRVAEGERRALDLLARVETADAARRPGRAA